ncbi:MAG: transcription antitermination factor NusB [Thiotrichales bacterium]|nr:transcription antitermination factor NusB [Thiotrichales bacterium]MBT4653780.1 transcription antitermination factor NusB [Thiotrichales bacterium]MBT5499175.1 transcription antitermination factor NusB [Thiotrichales bacterium]MBT5983967.1 transcription antitermination factor NusB [Thiotrichales bacterium]MBT6771826.1 transcription antitermination factor NusB [Thiotrichales bacterium]
MTPKQRSRARVVQALYQWLVSDEDILKIEQQFLNQKEGKISKAFFSNLFLNIPKKITILDEIIKPSLDRDIDELGPTEKAILYLGVYELKFQLEVPYKVVINEAVELTKLYGADGAFKLVNSCLDKIAVELRSLEVT